MRLEKNVKILKDPPLIINVNLDRTCNRHKLHVRDLIRRGPVKKMLVSFARKFVITITTKPSSSSVNTE